MKHYLSNRTMEIPVQPDSSDLFSDLEGAVMEKFGSDEVPIRFAVTASQSDRWQCEVGVLDGAAATDRIFRFKERAYEDASDFNVVMLVPTGIGAEIGGHAGDAAPAATLISNVCDAMITHPNVLNASDLIQIPNNAFYVEGSIITKMLMGTDRLLPTRSNRILVLIQSHEDRLFTEATINAVNAARAYYGLNIAGVVLVDPSFRMISDFSPSGAATGEILGIEHIFSILDARIGEFDAVAISSVIEVPPALHEDYYSHQGAIINPWGGVEAMLTHAISVKYSLPAAHSPMFESREVADLDVGVVDPRMAAEIISLTFFQSVLRGLHDSPRIFPEDHHTDRGIGAENISCLVIPDQCLGLPVLAALQQGITVITVRENANLMRNDLSALPWRPGQLIEVQNYWEAAGVLASLKAGLDPYTMRRPIEKVNAPFISNMRSTGVAMNGAHGGRSCA